MSLIVVEDESSDDMATASGKDESTLPEATGANKKRSVAEIPLTMEEKSYDGSEIIDTADNSNDDEEKPLLELMKHLINYNGKQNTKLTNNQLIGILKKEFELDVTNLHSISIDIYMNVLKKFLKDWPQWDAFDQVMHETRCMNDNEEVEKMLEREYLSLKDYLAAILKASKPFAREAAQRINRSQEIPESSRAVAGDVVLEVNCTRDQLNTLFFRKPHPEYKSTIFNIDCTIPSKISIKPLTFESMLNSCYVNITINLVCFKYRREMLPNFKHTLVNKSLQRVQKEPALNSSLQTPKSMKVDNRSIKPEDLKTMIQKIQRSNRYRVELQTDVEMMFKIITKDLDVFTKDMKLDLPCTFRYYLSSYPYIRYLYKDVDTQSEKYDIQLREKISPMLKFHVSRLNIYDSAVTTELNWLKLECTICNITYLGVTGIEGLKAHFREVHQNEPNWTCTRCDMEFCATELAAARWSHECQVTETE